jgi:hypothetical protein
MAERGMSNRYVEEHVLDELISSLDDALTQLWQRWERNRDEYITLGDDAVYTALSAAADYLAELRERRLTTQTKPQR